VTEGADTAPTASVPGTVTFPQRYVAVCVAGVPILIIADSPAVPLLLMQMLLLSAPVYSDPEPYPSSVFVDPVSKLVPADVPSITLPVPVDTTSPALIPIAVLFVPVHTFSAERPIATMFPPIMP
jgi:hypothetical protein